MDPDVTLAELREHVRIMNDRATTSSLRATHGEWLQERFEQLDGWLSRGGFPPSAWNQNPTTSVEDVQRELNAHPTWSTTPSAARDAARESCSFTTLAGTTSWSERCVTETLRAQTTPPRRDATWGVR